MEHHKLFAIIIPTLNEEEHIEKLLRSVHNQDYRPIEVLMIDGGSSDKTVEIAEGLKKELEEPHFRITIISQGDRRGLAVARNIGLENSTGEYVSFVDADVVLQDENLLKELSEVLKDQPLAWYPQEMIVDSWLEYHSLLDSGGKKARSPAFRREVLDKVMFDSSLGAGDDHDFLFRLRTSGILTDETRTVDAEAGFHTMHTFREYTIQKFWHGRTIWPYIIKNPRRILGALLIPVGPFGLLCLGMVTSFIHFGIGMGFLLVWSVVVLHVFLKSPKRSPGRLVYIAFNLSYGSLVRTVGALKGLFSYIRGTLTPGRDI